MQKVLILAFFLCSFSIVAQQPLLLKAAVAEGFSNGLHAKYLRYLAKQLDAEILITTMPFARRIQEIKKGNLDIIVGIQKTQDREDEFIYIEPHYETLSYRFFSLTENSSLTRNYGDLYNKLIGVNKHSKYFPVFDADKALQKIEVVSLRQNINLLLRGRIDLLIHYQESTLPTLTSMGILTKVSQTSYQPKHTNLLYVAISNKSSLIKQKEKLQNIVKQGIKNNDFAKIRQQHYQ